MIFCALLSRMHSIINFQIELKTLVVSHKPAVVSLISLKQFSPAIWEASIIDLRSASVKKLGTFGKIIKK